MVLDEGRNREVRRLLARVGHKVQRLKRVAVGPVRLGELPIGAVRTLSTKEIESLKRAVARGPKQGTHHGETVKPNREKTKSQFLKNHRGHKDHRERRTIIG